LKVVLDTNIVVSALLSPQGLSAKLLNLMFDKKLTIVYDNNIFAEYLEVLNRDKFMLDKELVNLHGIQFSNNLPRTTRTPRTLTPIFTVKLS